MRGLPAGLPASKSVPRIPCKVLPKSARCFSESRTRFTVDSDLPLHLVLVQLRQCSDY